MLLDLVLRITAAAVLIAIVTRLLAKHRHRPASIPSAALCVGLIAYLAAPYLLTPDRKTVTSFVVLTLALANPPLIWLVARRLFRERQNRGRGEVIALTSGVAMGLVFAYDLPRWLFGSAPLVELVGRVVPHGVALSFVFLAILEAQRDAQLDLVEPRRRLRVFFITGIAAYAAVIAVIEIALRNEPPPVALNLLHVGLLTGAALGAAVLVFKHGDSLLGTTAAPSPQLPSPPQAELEETEERQPEPAPAPPPLQPDPLQLELEAWIARRGFLEPELSVAKLAKTLRTQEYKLRRLLNGQLGFRNFNEFLHRHRIRVACEMLSEPSELSILALSMEVGYRSLATFNRAFKDVTGVSPTEYRSRHPGANHEN